MNRWFERLRWLRAVDTFTARLQGSSLAAISSANFRLRRSPERNEASNAEPYVRLARYWEAYHPSDGREYPGLLSAAERQFGCRTADMLDLACGTGRVSRKLAESGRSVVGLDVSQAMLLEAEARRGDLDIRFELGDYRNFDLGALRFDAAICVGDSLNYLASIDELDRVFRCVSGHLRPGGIFVFDSFGDAYLRFNDAVVVRQEVDGQEIEVRFQYDPERRRSEDRALIGDAIERHRRIPIERHEIAAAAGREGLEVVEQFSDADTHHVPHGGRLFTILRKPATVPDPDKVVNPRTNGV